MPPESQVHKQVVRKRAEARAIDMNPATRLYFIEVEEPDMHKPSSDLERVYRALAEQWNVADVSCNLTIMQNLQKVLRQGEWKVTVAVFSRPASGSNIMTAIWPGFHDKAFGLAVDVGSTTIAAHLCSLSTGDVVASSGLMNPQIRFGEDLMSRVSYVMMNPGGEKEMTAAIREALNTLAAQVATEASIDKTDILEAVLVGNPVMHHLFLGIDPTELGGAPFALATGLAVTRPAKGARPSAQSGRLCLCAALHRWPCRRRHGGRGAVGIAAIFRRQHAHRRCRHQCRDRARLQEPPARLLVADRPPLSKAPRSPAANAPRPAPSSASASIPSPSSRVIA